MIIKVFHRYIRTIIKSIMRNGKGFSLLELLIALGVFSIFLMIVWGVFFPFQRGYTNQQVKYDVLQKSRIALNYIADQIKIAGLDPKESGEFGIESAGPDHICFTFDTRTETEDFNGRLDTGNDERIIYRVIRNKENEWCIEEIKNAEWSASIEDEPVNEDRIIISGINDKSPFFFLDEEQNPLGDYRTPVQTSDLNKIRQVGLYINVIDPGYMGERIAKTLDTQVLCRNLFFNAQRN